MSLRLMMIIIIKNMTGNNFPSLCFSFYIKGGKGKILASDSFCGFRKEWKDREF